MATIYSQHDATKAPNPTLRGSYPVINAPAQTATLPTTRHDNGRNYGDTKETVDAYTLLAVTDGDIRELAKLRIYMGRSSRSTTVYASLWVHGGNGTAGSGKAGGGGYHKPSAAASAAFQSAGITLDAPISGCDDPAIEDALLAVGRALGYATVRVIRA